LSSASHRLGIEAPIAYGSTWPGQVAAGGRFNQRSSYTDLLSGDADIADILQRQRRGPEWSPMLVIVTYDENGGFWDHVPPPDRAGVGRPLGTGNAHTGADHFPAREARIYRQHCLRHHLDPEADHRPLRPRTAPRSA
jgi:Phosphoesterase family